MRLRFKERSALNTGPKASSSKNAKDKDKVDAKDKVDEMRGLVLSQVQEEGLKRAFARKAILSPRFVKLLLEKL